MNIATKFWGWALLVGVFGLVLWTWSSPAQADDIDNPTSSQCESNDPDIIDHITPLGQAKCGAGVADAASSGSSISKLIDDVVKILAWVVGVAAVIIILVQGLRMVLSNGDSNTIASARNGIIYAIVGLAIAISARHIVGYILNLVGS